MLDLGEEIRSYIDTGAPPVSADEVHARLQVRPRSHGLRLRTAPVSLDLRSDQRVPRRHLRAPILSFKTLGTVAAVLLVVAVLVAVLATQYTAAPSRQPTRAAKVEAPKWRLAAALSGPQFDVATGNPNAVVGVNCGRAGTCFLSTGYGEGGAASNNGSTYVSHDGGHSWQPSTLPANVAATTLVTCVSPTWCAAGGGLADAATGDPAAGKVMRDPELLATSDGGGSWTMRSVPIPPDVQQLPAYGTLPAETTYWPATVDAISCTGPELCHVVAHVLNSAASSGLTPDQLIFASTTDGGVSWTTTVLPELPDESGYEVEPAGGVAIASLSCATSSTCVAFARLAGFDPSHTAYDVWRTSDGGKTWNETRLATGPLIGPNSAVICPDAETCWAGPVFQGSDSLNGVLFRSTDGGATWTSVALPSSPETESSGQTQTGAQWNALGCVSASTCFVAGPGVDVTTDGGRSWTEAALPPQVNWVQSLSCGIGSPPVCIGAAVPKTSSDYFPYGGSLMIASGANS
jgi:hypothetical protein